MEHKRSIISCIFISAAIFLLTLSVYATNGNSSADVKTASSRIYSIILPVGTHGSFDFTIDPYGLSTMGESGKTLEELLKNPPGLVTSDAITIENRDVSDVAVKIQASLSGSAVNINLAKSEDEARAGMADLYLKMVAVNPLNADEPAPVMVFGETGQTEEIEFILEGTGDGKNSSCSFVIDGYANPYSAIWAGMTSQKIGLDITYTFEYIEKDETTIESSETITDTESSDKEPTKDPTEETTEDPTEETTKDPTSETTTNPDIPDAKDEVKYRDDIEGFDLYIKKTNLSAAPTRICIIYKNKQYNLSQFGLVKIESQGENYKIAVSDYSIEPGTYKLLVYSGTTLIYDKAQLHVE